MQTTTTNELSCSVFGHNLEHSSVASNNSRELTCKTCQSKVSVSDDGEFKMSPFKNREIDTALRQLFILKSQYLQRRASA